ncbi:NAD(P)/FAD-dependent oxidoreductase [Candidatus Puniceispirillum sp.]|uniref:NAD(P)/FAD-dependent oxidoreductase n=1 Tax=Candidatus Puniceispirillum sp. TaxID=2026719 RepID=UPI003F69C93B
MGVAKSGHARSAPFAHQPCISSYDVIIIGGAMLGSSVAWFLSQNSDFNGSVLVIEMDASYSMCSTAHTNSCMRQQFSTELNIQISQFGADFVRNFRSYMGDDPDIPTLAFQTFGYMYLADNDGFADILRANQKIQQACGAGTKIMSPDAIRDAYPFYELDDIILGSHNLEDEGYFDGHSLFDWWKRKARKNGVEYIENEVIGIDVTSGKVTHVTLASGEQISAGYIVNASGPRAVLTARMAGLDLPVEPRRRYSFIFDAETRLDRDLPLTIDPSGVHMRSDSVYYLAGCPPDDDADIDYDDFEMDHDIWIDKAWPAIATRVPAFEAVKLINSWVGHYAYNKLDQNAIIGAHPERPNFMFINGFSGHGLQQSPAMGRAMSELLTYGEYRTLDLSPLGYERVMRNEPLLEKAVI